MCTALSVKSAGQKTVEGPAGRDPLRSPGGFSPRAILVLRSQLAKQRQALRRAFLAHQLFSLSLALLKIALRSGRTKPQQASRGLWKVLQKTTRVAPAAFRRAVCLFPRAAIKMPQAERLKHQRFRSSQFWMLEVQDQGVSRFGFF